FRYGYDLPAARIAKWFQTAGNQATMIYNLSYDDADQLKSAAASQSGTDVITFAYTYDLAGNRLAGQINAAIEETRYNALNQLTASADGPSTTYEWDAEHRLVVVSAGDHRTE